MANSQLPIDELLSICSPSQWKDFMFEMITTFVSSGQVETFTKNSREDFIVKIQGLYNYFAQLEHSRKEL